MKNGEFFGHFLKVFFKKKKAKKRKQKWLKKKKTCENLESSFQNSKVQTYISWYLFLWEIEEKMRGNVWKRMGIVKEVFWWKFFGFVFWYWVEALQTVVVWNKGVWLSYLWYIWFCLCYILLLYYLDYFIKTFFFEMIKKYIQLQRYWMIIFILNFFDKTKGKKR